jgi:1-acyl-sn-glycerol-3-phosphate acyltransferase
MSKAKKTEDYETLMHKNRIILTEHFNPAFRDSLIRHVIKPINDAWFRCKYVGFDEPIERNNPRHPVILIKNHSGMAFPWDGMMFTALLVMRNNYERETALTTLTAPMLSMTTLMNPFLMRDAWYKAGGVDATFLNFETVMNYGQGNVLIYPEGVPGIGKGFNNKYKLQRLATSFLRMSIKYRTDVVPVATVNAEYINPYSLSFEWVNRLTKKIGIPFLPITILLILLIFQPWMFYFGLPARITYVKGKRMKPYEWTDKAYEDLNEDDLLRLQKKAGKIMQLHLNESVEKYGRKPYDWASFFRSQWRNIRYFPFNTVVGWPFLFEEYKRLIKKHPDGNFELKVGWGSFFPLLIKNPIILAYYLPVIGWAFILYIGYKGQRITKKK